MCLNYNCLSKNSHNWTFNFYYTFRSGLGNKYAGYSRFDHVFMSNPIEISAFEGKSVHSTTGRLIKLAFKINNLAADSASMAVA